MAALWAWVRANTYVVIGILLLIAVGLVAIRRLSEASFAAMVIGTLLMMRCEIEREG